jgi:hypothetical protein
MIAGLILGEKQIPAATAGRRVGLESVGGPGLDGLAVHLLEFDAVKMLRESVQVGDLMWRLWT